MSATAGKEEYVFIRNTEIPVNKPSHYLNSIFVIFLACQCSLLLCVIIKLSIKDNQSNCMYKFSPLFFLTNEIELIMSAP